MNRELRSPQTSHVNVHCSRRRSVAPGLCLTNEDAQKQWESYADDRQQQIVEGTAMRRLGTASDISNAVMFFASGSSGWCSGQVLEVNGGGR